MAQYQTGERAFELSDAEFRELTQQDCHYCGAAPSQRTPGRQTYKTERAYQNALYIYNGLDRVDNERGYELDNVVPCCGACNRAKRTESYDDFLRRIETIYLHRIKGMT